MKVAYKEDGKTLFIRVCSNRMRGNGFQLKEGRFRLDMRKKSSTMSVVKCWNSLSGEAVDGCPITGSVQGQAGLSFGQPDLVEYGPAHGRGVGFNDLQKSLLIQTIPSLDDSLANESLL